MKSVSNLFDRACLQDYHFVAEFENPDPSEGEEAHEDEVGGDLALGDEEGDSREDPSSSSTAESEDGGDSGGSEAGCESDSSESDSGESDSGESGDGDVVSVPLASPPLATVEEFPTPKEENPVDPKLKKSGQSLLCRSSVEGRNQKPVPKVISHMSHLMSLGMRSVLARNG